MKKNPLVLLLLFLLPMILFFGILPVKSQDNIYHPLVQEGKCWSIVSVDDCGGIQNLKFTTTQMAFFGDTVISDVPYKKMYISAKEFPIFPQDWTLQNFMREDEDKKVWYKRNSGSEEKLYYDFSLEIGDTIPEDIGEQLYFEPAVIVEDISYITMQNGEKHKMLHLSILCSGYPSHKEYWIEGIGSSLGVLFPITGMLVGGYTRLLCVHENNELLFNTNFWRECYKDGSNGITVYNHSINIFPNPAVGMLYINMNESMKINGISLINTQGQTVRFYEFTAPQLDISNLSKGLYFIKLSSSEGDIIKKIIIN